MNDPLIIPIFRIFDEAKAKEFYVDFLGFTVDFEHRFADDFPLYMQISRTGWTMHLSEHHGDGSPGASILLRLPDVESYHKELLAKNYKHSRPELEKTEFGTLQMSIGDPFGNQLTFYKNIKAE